MAKLIESPKLLNQEPYASIMNLLEICRQFHPEYDGLTHAHFLYALMDKPKMTSEKKEELRNYFKKLFFPPLSNKNIKHPKLKSLDNCYYNENSPSLFQWQLNKGVVKNPQRLNEKLNTLINMGWIDPKGKPRYKKYYSSDKYQRFINIFVINYLINKLSGKELSLYVSIISSMKFLSNEGLNKLKKTIYQYPCSPMPF